MSREIDRTGFAGFHQVEVFSDRYWVMDQDEFLKLIIERYQRAGLRERIVRPPGAVV